MRDGAQTEFDLSALYSESIDFFNVDRYIETFIGFPINFNKEIKALFTQTVSGNGQYFTAVMELNNDQLLAVSYSLYANYKKNLPFSPSLAITTQGHFNYTGQRFITHNGQLYGQAPEAYRLLGKIPAGANFLSADGLTAYRFNRTPTRVWLSVFDLAAATDAQGQWPQTSTIELMQPANAELDAEQTPVFEVPQNGQMVFIAQGGTVWTVPLL